MKRLGRPVGKPLKPSGQAKAELLCGAEIPSFFLGGAAKARYGAGRIVYRRSATGAFLHVPIMWLQIILDKWAIGAFNVATLNKEA